MKNWKLQIERTYIFKLRTGVLISKKYIIVKLLKHFISRVLGVPK